MEDLNIGGMLKNRRLARAISDVGWYALRSIIEYKCKLHSISFVLADRMFPSTKLMPSGVKVDANLGEIYLYDPIYKVWVHRDLNAAMNLARYQSEGSERTIMDMETV
jgi:putative transposase